MKHLFHTIILSLTITSFGLPALADNNDHTCPEPPEAAFEAVNAISPMVHQIASVHQIAWQEHKTPAAFLVILHTKSMAPLQVLSGIAFGVCKELRAEWNPECGFYVHVMEIPWGGESVIDCEHR